MIVISAVKQKRGHLHDIRGMVRHHGGPGAAHALIAASAPFHVPRHVSPEDPSPSFTPTTISLSGSRTRHPDAAVVALTRRQKASSHGRRIVRRSNLPASRRRNGFRYESKGFSRGVIYAPELRERVWHGCGSMRARGRPSVLWCMTSLRPAHGNPAQILPGLGTYWVAHTSQALPPLNAASQRALSGQQLRHPFLEASQ